MAEVESSRVPAAGASSRARTRRCCCFAGQEERAGCLSTVLFLWIIPLFGDANRKTAVGDAIGQEDLCELPRTDASEHLQPTFSSAWAKYLKIAWSRNPDAAELPVAERNWVLRKVAAVVLGRSVLVTAGLVKLLNSTLQFSFPLLLNGILRYLEEGGFFGAYKDATWPGILLAVLLASVMAVKAVTENNYFHMVYRGGWKLRSSITTAVYDKALRLSAASRQQKSIGQIVNLMQIDASKLEMFVGQLHVFWDGIYQIVGYMALLIHFIGASAIVGLVLMILAMPVQGKIMKRLFKLNASMVKITDSRVKLTNECLQGIQGVKMYGWEESFIRVIGSFRKQEHSQLTRIAYLRAFSRAYMGAVPAFVAAISMVTYAFTGGNINASILFTALTTFGQLRFPLMFYPMALAQYVQAKVSLTRVSEFLIMDEVSATQPEGGNTSNGASSPETPIVLRDLTVAWGVGKRAEEEAKDDASKQAPATETKADPEQTRCISDPVLKSVNLTVARGELVAIVGAVGSGKSSLCNALLNEMHVVDGSVAVSGSIAYSAQTAWILNASIEDNITFGTPVDRERYRATIRACQLTHDMEILEDGDQTMIGERGINLSGGQKQRVSVARAAYSNRDIIIFDDPMSALDPEVAHALFRECIKGMLAGKTRILVTNSVDILSECDRIVVLDSNMEGDSIGRIREQGTFDELVQAGLDFANLIEELGADEAEGSAAAAAGESEDVQRQQQTGNETKNDAKARDGRASSEVQITSRSHGSASRDSRTGSELSDKKGKKTPKKLMNEEERNRGAVKCSIYFSYLIASGGFCWFAFVYFWFIVREASQVFNTAWIGVWTADHTYENQTMLFYTMGLIVIAFVSAFFAFLRSALLALLAVRASSSMHDKLLRSVLKAPTASFFDVTPTGRIISRFSKDINTMDEQLGNFLDFFLFCSLYVLFTFGAIIFATPWFAAAALPILFIYIYTINYFRPVYRESKRLESVARSPVYAHFSETLGGLITIRAFKDADRFIKSNMKLVDESIRSYYVMKSADRWLSLRLELIGCVVCFLAALLAVLHGRSSSYASIAGVSLTYAISVTGLLNWTVRSFVQVEAGMNCVERVLFYTNHIPHESETGTEPPADWPRTGDVEIRNLNMRYRKDTQLVLKDVSFTVKSGHRIGLVGRTGSGKSSLMLAIMRLVEPEVGDAGNATGPIMIDGLDTMSVPLSSLRKQVGIIPQNPTLFSGTVRSNLDPFNEKEDAELWRCLELCELKSQVVTMGGLDGAVSEYGENMSQGQRQLLCLGRALLMNCRVLLLDEATSSIDLQTDAIVQRTIRENFTDCTILTIAHRLETVIDNDKILVLDDGRVMEYDEPYALLQNQDSLFASIVSEMGESALQRLSGLARNASEARREGAEGKGHDS